MAPRVGQYRSRTRRARRTVDGGRAGSVLGGGGRTRLRGPRRGGDYWSETTHRRRPARGVRGR